MTGEQYIDENGDIWVKFKDQSADKTNVNNSKLAEKESQNDTETDDPGDKIDVNNNQIE